MNQVPRYLHDSILADLNKGKMVFLSGPRQVGKTYFAEHLLEELGSDQYLNWDRKGHRKIILKENWDRNASLIVFDELHKFRQWKSWIKGIYDTEKKIGPRILVTGSAKLNVFRKGGESLMGRYHHYRMHPFDLRELVQNQSITPQESLARLWQQGGFPEPFFAQSLVDADRWRKERLDNILREDILTLENVRNLSGLETLIEFLRRSVGSTISYQNLSEDLHVSPQTVKSWIDLLERVYVVFVVRPYSKQLPRAIRKEPKVYFYDYSDIESEAARFENFIASHLLKWCHFLEDTQGMRLGLNFLRDKEKREVDFVVTLNGYPRGLIEAKLSKTTPHSSLYYYQAKLGASAFLLHNKTGPAQTHDSVRTLDVASFFLKEIDGLIGQSRS